MTLYYHSIIGLPGSGKTTFLAALWHLLDADEASTKFVLDKLVGDNTYLNTIVEAWRKCDRVPRTSMMDEKKISIHVQEVSSQKKAILNFPDMAGETYEHQLKTRSCKIDYVEELQQSGGVMLFLTADRPSDGLSIVDVAFARNPSTINEIIEEHKEWSMDCVSEQVKLVELLQFVQSILNGQRICRIAILVSAWDVIKNPNLSPDNWLKRELPFLYQFLVTNVRSFEFQVYGVSAQGGNVTNEEKGNLISKIPSERIMCIGPDADPHDITSPIAWLMSGE